ncbi:hypothetical protein BH09MYX1_BH09MYX1_28140 [soil metagenome]
MGKPAIWVGVAIEADYLDRTSFTDVGVPFTDVGEAIPVKTGDTLDISAGQIADKFGDIADTCNLHRTGGPMP